jgi:hypothetical protein
VTCGTLSGVTLLVSRVDRNYNLAVPSSLADIYAKRGFHFVRIIVIFEVIDQAQHGLKPSSIGLDSLGHRR